MTITQRDIDRRLLGGVCARLARRYDYDVTGVRVATVALALLTAGLGGVAYVALWLLLPPATAPIAPAAPAPAAALYGPVAGDLPRVDEALRALAEVKSPWLRQMIETVVGGGGKRMRPAIALLAGRFGSYDLALLVPLAASVELLHTATLVHDDVIDGATQRRGQPTPSALFGNAASVMLGDYLFAHAADLVAQTGNVRVIRNFAATLRVMAGGELQQDLSAFEYSEDVQRYLERIGGKTASLFATAAEGGAIITGATEAEVAALRRYGESLGTAFQVVDDVLDLTGDQQEMGKPVGSDLREGTLTLPALLYLQDAPADNPVKRAFDDPSDEELLERAIAAIRASDALPGAMVAARGFGDQAREALAALPPGEARTALEGLIDYVLERRS
ncbi:MAG: PspC domain-containing protein [Dehalococcoidia bacterium]|nr:PspC domain-containing protein [Dehalococcoidia bacterium]